MKYPIRENAELLIKVMIVTNISSATKNETLPNSPMSDRSKTPTIIDNQA